MKTRARILTHQRRLSEILFDAQVLNGDMCADDLAVEALPLGQAIVKILQAKRQLQNALAATDQPKDTK